MQRLVHYIPLNLWIYLFEKAEQLTLLENVLQSDLWSVGVILFQLVTGKLPYTGSTYFQVLLLELSN
jgi:serine/threonine protein kinase